MIRRLIAPTLLAAATAVCIGCGSDPSNTVVSNGPPAGGPKAQFVAPSPPAPPPGGPVNQRSQVVNGPRRR